MPMNAPLPPVSLGENSPHPVAVPLLARRGTRSHAAWDAELMAKRLDTRLESEGAEFLVLGNLLIAGIEATKAYRNFEGFDLYATNPAAGNVCRIQVKSRWATDYDGGFPIKNVGSDFVVFVALNRGYRYGRKGRSSEAGLRAPDFFVIPTRVVVAAKDPKSTWGKAYLRRMDDPDQYRDRWDLIRSYLGMDS
jgi:hypothetical protein